MRHKTTARSSSKEPLQLFNRSSKKTLVSNLQISVFTETNSKEPGGSMAAIVLDLCAKKLQTKSLKALKLAPLMCRIMMRHHISQAYEHCQGQAPRVYCRWLCQTIDQWQCPRHEAWNCLPGPACW